MKSDSQAWRTLPQLSEKPPHFIDAVANYLVLLDRLSLQQRRDLAVFKDSGVG